MVYVLNEKEDLDVHMKPAFVALFAFMFAVGLWAIFEFAMDGLFGLNMQKSGVTDTMWDLIVNTVGALAMVLGYGYLTKSRNESFLERSNALFIQANRCFFEETQQYYFCRSDIALARAPSEQRSASMVGP